MIKIVLVANRILNLAEEFLKNLTYRKRCSLNMKKKGLGRGLSALFGDQKMKEKPKEKI